MFYRGVVWLIITRETDYAIRILRALEGKDVSSIREISDTEYIPLQFAYKIAKKLDHAGCIEIIRGPHGGCRLVKDLHAVTLFEIIQITDRENMVTSCMNEEFYCMYREVNEGCIMHTSLCQVQSHITKYLKTLTIHDLIFLKKGRKRKKITV